MWRARSGLLGDVRDGVARHQGVGGLPARPAGQRHHSAQKSAAAVCASGDATENGAPARRVRDRASGPCHPAPAYGSASFAATRGPIQPPKRGTNRLTLTPSAPSAHAQRIQQQQQPNQQSSCSSSSNRNAAQETPTTTRTPPHHAVGEPCGDRPQPAATATAAPTRAPVEAAASRRPFAVPPPAGTAEPLQAGVAAERPPPPHTTTVPLQQRHPHPLYWCGSAESAGMPASLPHTTSTSGGGGGRKETQQVGGGRPARCELPARTGAPTYEDRAARGDSQPAMSSSSAAGDVHSPRCPPLILPHPPRNHAPQPTARASLPCVRGRPSPPLPRHRTKRAHVATCANQNTDAGGRGGGTKERGGRETERAGGDGRGNTPPVAESCGNTPAAGCFCLEEGTGVHSWSRAAHHIGPARGPHPAREGGSWAAAPPPLWPSSRHTPRPSLASQGALAALRCAGGENKQCPPTPHSPPRRGDMSTDRPHRRGCGMLLTRALGTRLEPPPNTNHTRRKG